VAPIIVEYPPSEKDDFFKYEIAIIELQMEGNDPAIKDVFQRLNRIFYSLTNIEKLSTEYAPSEFMLLAKHLTQEIELKLPKDETEIDPKVPNSFIKWALKNKVNYFEKLVLDQGIFSGHELARQVHLMATLNILGTIVRGFFNRNISAELIDEYSESFPEKDVIFQKVEKIAKQYIDLNLPHGSYWFNKANFFSLVVLFYHHFDKLVEKTSPKTIATKLKKFEKSLPDDYALAAKEAVNNKKERLIRHNQLETLLVN